MRAWWCSTPWTPRTKVPPSCRARNASARCLPRRPPAAAGLPPCAASTAVFTGFARARWSTPPASGRPASCATARGARARARCASSRAATSSCRRMFGHSMAYILQSPDKRIVFAIPYEQDFTLIGTTDVEQAGEPGEVRISAGGSRVSLRAHQPLLQPLDKPLGRRLELFRRAAADGRRVWRPVGGHPRLLARTDDGRPAVPDGVGRQDHHLPQAGRGGGGPAPAGARAAGTGKWAGPGRSTRRCRGATSRRCWAACRTASSASSSCAA